MRVTLGRSKLLKNGKCRPGYVLTRGGKTKRRACVSRKRAAARRRRR